MRAYAKQAKDFDMANWAAEIRIRAERKLGGMLKAQKEACGMRDGGSAMKARSHGDSELPPKLSDMGITHSMSSRAQAIASVPEAEFEQTIAEHREKQKELTSNTIRAHARVGWSLRFVHPVTSPFTCSHNSVLPFHGWNSNPLQ